ncbi:unnamed protein product [Boreogadus saida]
MSFVGKRRLRTTYGVFPKKTPKRLFGNQAYSEEHHRDIRALISTSNESPFPLCHGDQTALAEGNRGHLVGANSDVRQGLGSGTLHSGTGPRVPGLGRNKRRLTP